MYFGLIKTTSGWYHGRAALRQFSIYSLLTLTTCSFLVFLHYRPLLFGELRATGVGKSFVLCMGVMLVFSWMGLMMGMAWYFWKLDKSRMWVKLLWIAVALILSPYAEVAYFAFVYRENVLAGRRLLGYETFGSGKECADELQ
jgi:hypothetical protein